MIHKRAYYRGLLKIAAANLKQFYGTQVGRSTHTNTLPTEDVVINGKPQTYGDFGFQNSGVHNINWAALDKRKAEATAQGKQYDPSFIEFITDKNLAGQHYIPRESIDRMSHEMARIRGGQTPLSKRNVDYSDTLKYLNAAYKHGRLLDYSSDNKSNYLDNASSAYKKYLDTRKDTPYVDTNEYNTDPKGTSDEPDEVSELPTTPIAKHLTPVNKPLPQPLISDKQLNALVKTKGTRAFFNAYDMLRKDAALRKAYVNGDTTYGNGLEVGDRFGEVGYAKHYNSKDAWSRQRAYQRTWDAVRSFLGKDESWMYENMDQLTDLYLKYNNSSN